MNTPKVTPMLQQYLEIKAQYPDAILFYRMGDFYEMFFEDAHTASRALEITLTSRNKQDEIPVPMCGVPVRAADGYIGRLIAGGFRIAVCEQVEDPSAAKGLVKREVVRLITPGMIVDNELLDEKSNNYILSIARSGKAHGLASLDISTGAFRVCQTSDLSAIADEARRINPSEILAPDAVLNDPEVRPLLDSLKEKAITPIADPPDHRRAYEKLTRQFRTRSLEAFGCETLDAAVLAAGTLLEYVIETQKQPTAHLSGLETCFLDDHLYIDDQSRRNLELTSNLRTGSRQGTLLGLLDLTVTAMGARRLDQWMRYPLRNAPDIERRLEAVQATLDAPDIRSRMRDRLKSVHDMERLAGKLNLRRGNARDLVALKTSLQQIPEILHLLAPMETGLFRLDMDLAPLNDLASLIERAIRDDAPLLLNEGGFIREGFDSSLDELIAISRDGKGFLASIESREKQRTGIQSLKVKFNRVFGYYLEVPKAHAERVPPDYVRKQTLVNAERYITDELKTFEDKVLGAQEQRTAIELELFEDIRAEVIRNNDGILTAARFIAAVDCLFSLAETASRSLYVRPAITDDGVIDIEDGRHPVVEKTIAGERFVPNSIRLDNTENQVLVITGPNMAGKSTILRQTALIVLMAQMGSFVPARKASISLTDRIFTRVGALDNLSAGQSTFMVEMEETANILNHASPASLIIMDEIGRGTSTFDGLSIAWAVAEYIHGLHGQGVKTLFATHYHELTRLAEKLPRVKNFNIVVKEWNDEIIFLRKLAEGATNRSYGIQVARLAGLPEDVIRRAKNVLHTIENGQSGPDATTVPDDASAGGRKKPVQLSLFRRPEEVVMEALAGIDVDTLTPLEALNLLHDLKTKAGSPRLNP